MTSYHRRAAIAFFVLAAASLLMLAGTLSLGDLRDEVAHPRTREAAFREAVRFIAVERSRHGRLPSQAELSAFSEPRHGADNVSFTPLETGCCGPALDRLGAPPQGSYMLRIWDGDLFQYYAPWSGRSTLPLDEGDFFLSGQRSVDIFMAGGATASFLLAGLCLWRRRRATPAPLPGPKRLG
jgi:hypothetical protein